MDSSETALKRKCSEIDIDLFLDSQLVKKKSCGKIGRISNVLKVTGKTNSTNLEERKSSTSTFRNSPKKTTHLRRKQSPRKCDEFTSLEDVFQEEIDFGDFNEKENSSHNSGELKNLFNCTEDEGSDHEKLLDLSDWKRCKVLDIHRDSKTFELILELQEEIQNTANNGQRRKCFCRLRGPWNETKISTNDVISIHGKFDKIINMFVVDFSQGTIVLHPDILLSGTTVAGSLFCQRKSILQDKFQGIYGDNKIMIIGKIVHELLQMILKNSLKSSEEIERAASEMLNSSPEISFSLYSSKMSMEEVRIEIQPFLSNISTFIETYVEGKNDILGGSSDIFTGVIDSIEDIEENLWVPRLGLKGKIDVSVRVKPRKSVSSTGGKYVPLELKTGKASFSAEHKGQLMLYQIMLNNIKAEKDENVESGLLLYLRDGIMKEIRSKTHEQSQLIMLRNELAYYIAKNTLEDEKYHKLKSNETSAIRLNGWELPEPISYTKACLKCPYNTICFTFLRTDKQRFDSLKDDHPLKITSSECTSHLTDECIKYFIKWCSMITLEDQESKKTNPLKNLWVETPEERHRKGRALMNLRLVENVESFEGRFRHRFINSVDKGIISKSSKDEEENLSPTKYSSTFSVGDYVIVSCEKRIAVATGQIYDIDKDYIVVNLERNLIFKYKNKSFIIDHYESQTRNVFNFTNLGVLLEDTDVSNRLRKIIIDKENPKFSKLLPRKVQTECLSIIRELNSLQQKAIIKALTTEDYVLIKGLPGTGKTQTLVAFVRILEILGKSVLITSHTHSAVDNLLIRLKAHNLKFLRLGSEVRILKELHEFSEDSLLGNLNTPEDLKKFYNSYNIVGVTCLGMNHPIFQNRKFDYCIVDEATQVFQPTVLRPLFFTNKFILVGDPDQLPPLVRSKVGRTLGADESLFQRLDTPKATSVLSLQYRMNKGIMKIANELTYNGELKCDEAILYGFLKLPNREKFLKENQNRKWIVRSLEKHVDQSVILLDTLDCSKKSEELKLFFVKMLSESTKSSPQEKKIQKSYINYCEAIITFALIDVLLGSGFSATNIGVITPFRAQVDFLRRLFELISSETEGKDFSKVEVNTVDQYQGRDKEIILYSCTKTGICHSSDLNENEILEDKRRLTVAITRSKHKLIIIGDAECLSRYTPLRELFTKITSMNKIKLEEGKLGFSWNEIALYMQSFLGK